MSQSVAAMTLPGRRLSGVQALRNRIRVIVFHLATAGHAPSAMLPHCNYRVDIHCITWMAGILEICTPCHGGSSALWANVGLRAVAVALFVYYGLVRRGLSKKPRELFLSNLFRRA